MDEKSKKYINIFYFTIFIVLISSLFFYRNSFLEKNKTDEVKIENQISKVKNGIENKRKDGLNKIDETRNKISEIKIKNRIYKVEIRNTEEGRREGLSNTNSDYLCDSSKQDTSNYTGCGLLFAWYSEGERIIWMKDMNYPINIYWLNKDMKIVHSEYNVATSTYNKANTKSSKIFGKGVHNAQYVLETKVYK